MTIKRYGLSIRYAESVGIPDIVEMPNGEYVKYSDMAACINHNEMLLARLKIASAMVDELSAQLRKDGE